VRAVNLIPEDQRGSAGGVGGHSQGAAHAVLALVGGVALLALLYGVANRQVSSRRGEVASLNARAERAQADATGLAPYTSFIALREQREQAVSEIVDSRFDWAHTFHELGRVLPLSASISSIEGSVASSTGSGSSSGGSGSSSGGSGASSGASGGSGAAAAKPSAAGASSSVGSITPPGSVPTVTLGGCATSQAAVAFTLNRLRLMDGVSEVTLQNSTKNSGAGAGGTGLCPPGGPAFTVRLTFEPMPAASAIRAASIVPAATFGGAR
jgi:hypothetical protein